MPSSESDRDSLPPVFDEGCFAQLVGLLGADRARFHLERLYDQMRLAFAGDATGPDARERHRGEAHAIKTLATWPGLMRFASTCDRLEAACGDGSNLDAALADVRRSRAEALERLSRLISELG